MFRSRHTARRGYADGNDSLTASIVCPTIFGRPFPSQICFADVRGILHRLSRDRLKGLAPEHIGRERRKQVDRQLSCAT